jgi:hypothetical protein
MTRVMRPILSTGRVLKTLTTAFGVVRQWIHGRTREIFESNNKEMAALGIKEIPRKNRHVAYILHCTSTASPLRKQEHPRHQLLHGPVL